MKRKSKHILISTTLLATLIFSACGKEASIQSTAPPTNGTNVESTNNFGSIPLELVEHYFDQIKKLCDDDNGTLWGRNIYSPMLIIDPETHDIVANEPDNEGKLEKRGNVYVGKFPEDSIIANSTTTFGGKKWSMVNWPSIPDHDAERIELLCHEMFHYQQQLLGLVSETDLGYDNSHMDEMDARISIQLEWNALISALKSQGSQREEAIRDALAIRFNRRKQFSSTDNENKFEMHEGLPDYTGIKLSYTSDKELLKAVLRSETQILSRPSFVRNFGYLSGTLYGLLLDKAQPDWRANITYNSDLGELLQDAYDIQDIDALTTEIKSKYNYEQISKSEAKIKAKKDKTIADYITKFTKDPTLSIPSDHWNYSFDPGTLQPLPDLGTVYPTIEIKSDWGTLTVSDGGCLIASDNSKAVVSAQGIDIKANKITGNGWILVLANGYGIKENEQNYLVYKINK